MDLHIRSTFIAMTDNTMEFPVVSSSLLVIRPSPYFCSVRAKALSTAILSGTECTLFSYIFFYCSYTLSTTASRSVCFGVSSHSVSGSSSMYFLSLRIYCSCCLIALRILLLARFLHLARFR